MQSNADWSSWADALRKYNLDGFVSWLLEAGAPIRVLGAQLLYFGQPFGGRSMFGSIAGMLENEEEARKFAGYLRGEAGE